MHEIGFNTWKKISYLLHGVYAYIAQIIDTVIRKVVKDLSAALVSRGIQVQSESFNKNSVFRIENTNFVRTHFLTVN